MTLLFQDNNSGAFSMMWCGPRVIASIVICSIAGVCLTYFLRYEFGLLPAMMISAVCIAIGIAIRASLQRIHVPQAHRRRRNKGVAQRTPEWDYRPRHRTRQYAAGACEHVREQVQTTSKDEHIWFKFIDREPTLKPPLWTSNAIAIRNGLRHVEEAYADA